MPKRPGGDGIPYLPEDLTALDDRSLIGLLQQYTVWYAYVAGRLSIAEVDEEESEIALKQQSAQDYVLAFKGKGDLATRAKAERDASPATVALQQQQLERYAIRKLMQSVLDGIEKKANLVSRELTRRTNMEPANRRTHRHTP